MYHGGHLQQLNIHPSLHNLYSNNVVLSKQKQSYPQDRICTDADLRSFCIHDLRLIADALVPRSLSALVGRDQDHFWGLNS